MDNKYTVGNVAEGGGQFLLTGDKEPFLSYQKTKTLYSYEFLWVISPRIGGDDFFSCKVSRAQVAISVYDLAIEKSPRTASIKAVLVIPLKVPK